MPAANRPWISAAPAPMAREPRPLVLGPLLPSGIEASGPVAICADASRTLGIELPCLDAYATSSGVAISASLPFARVPAWFMRCW